MTFPQIVFDNPTAETSKDYIQKANELLLPPCSKLIVFFDSNDHTGAMVDHLYKSRGFFYDLRSRHELNFIPESLSVAINRSEPDFLIWISKRISEGNLVRILQVYSHELQHLRHFLLDKEVYYLGLLVCLFLKSFRPDSSPFDYPNELDCERTAIRTVKTVLGEHGFQNYINDADDETRSLHKIFLRADQLSNGNTKEELVKIVSCHKEEFKRALEESPIPDIQENIDLFKFLKTGF